MKFQSWEPQSAEEVAEFITRVSAQAFNEPGWYQIAVVLRDGGNLIGDCGIHILEDDSRIAEIGITIEPASQSRGYATEALRAIFGLLFDKLEKHRVIASVDPRNLPSMALMERIGMRKEGHFVKSLWFKNEWADDVTYAMLAAEWKTKKRVDSFL